MNTTELNQIGLDIEHSSELADQLNNLLANFQVYYQNLLRITFCVPKFYYHLTI